MGCCHSTHTLHLLPRSQSSTPKTLHVNVNGGHPLTFSIDSAAPLLLDAECWGGQAGVLPPSPCSGADGHQSRSPPAFPAPPTVTPNARSPAVNRQSSRALHLAAVSMSRHQSSGRSPHSWRGLAPAVGGERRLSALKASRDTKPTSLSAPQRARGDALWEMDL